MCQTLVCYLSEIGYGVSNKTGGHWRFWKKGYASLQFERNILVRVQEYISFFSNFSGCLIAGTSGYAWLPHSLSSQFQTCRKIMLLHNNHGLLLRWLCQIVLFNCWADSKRKLQNRFHIICYVQDRSCSVLQSPPQLLAWRPWWDPAA